MSPRVRHLANRARMRSRSAGFSLIEVLVALLILAFGLLGFALLQTTNLKFSQSANYRTQATNLAYDLLDQIRANRLTAGQYVAQISGVGSFGGVAAASCTRPATTFVTPADSANRWKCQLRKALGDGAFATVTQAGTTITVTVNWADARGAVGEENAATSSFGSLAVSTEL